MPPKSTPKKLSRFSAELHGKFRRAIRKIRSQRSPRFVKSRKAYVLRGQVFKGAHGVLFRAFGSLQRMIYAAGGCEPNNSRSATATSRGNRVGRELCRLAATATGKLAIKSKKGAKALHEWTPAVSLALRRWGVYLVDGEVPVHHRYIATGIDLLGVQRDPTDARKWRLVCVELKTGYRGPVWRAKSLGKTQAGVDRSVMNYALTQAQLTHECAVKTFKEYDFAPPMVVLVNDDGVKRFTPNDDIRAQTAALWKSD